MAQKGLLRVVGILGLLLLCGCHSTSNQGDFLRLAEDPPEVFQPPAGMELNQSSCLSPLTDPRDGTTIILEKSYGNNLGDYKVPKKKYNVSNRELLRINCKTGKVIGIVKY